MRWAAFLAAVALPVAASAQAQSADTSRIAASLCASAAPPFPAITRQEIAEAVVYQAGVLPAQVTGTSESNLVAALHTLDLRAASPAVGTLSTRDLQLAFTTSVFEQKLAAGTEAGLEVVGTLPKGANWLFAPVDGSVSWALRCKTSTAAQSIVASYGLKEKQPFAIRQKPEELAAGGETRTKAGAFALGLSRSWKEDATGAETATTTLTVDGTVGLRLTPAVSAQTVYAFAQYNLKRVRTDPPAPLAPGERRDAKDTNVLAAGVLLDIFSEVDGTAFWAVIVRDFADRSTRIRFNATVDPGFSADLGLCRLGSQKIFGGSGLGARCLVRADVEGGLWTDRGLTAAKAYDDYVAAGGFAAYELYLANGPKAELLATASYRYLPMLVGDLDDIARLELSLKQRFWTETGLGFDVGANYVDGTNSLSLTDERTLSVGFGVIF
jgi:hypothetical protein